MKDILLNKYYYYNDMDGDCFAGIIGYNLGKGNYFCLDIDIRPCKSDGDRAAGDKELNVVICIEDDIGRVLDIDFFRVNNAVFTTKIEDIQKFLYTRERRLRKIAKQAIEEIIK